MDLPPRHPNSIDETSRAPRRINDNIESPIIDPSVGRAIPVRCGRPEATREREHCGIARDCDDLLAPVLEFIVPGSYGWLPLTQLKTVSLMPARGYTDVIWIPAQITFHSPPSDQPNHC